MSSKLGPNRLLLTNFLKEAVGIEMASLHTDLRLSYLGHSALVLCLGAHLEGRRQILYSVAMVAALSRQVWEC